MPTTSQTQPAGPAITSAVSGRPRQAVLHLMVQQGGAFAHHIGRAWLVADPANSARLAAAFGDLFADYAAQLPAEVPA